MNLRLLAALLILLALPALAAPEPRCARGVPEVQRDLWNGYSLVIGPPADESHKNLCRAAIVGPGGKVLFEATDSEAALDPISGQDVNGDGQPDVVLETRPAGGKCCYGYYVVSLADPPGLLRAFSVSVPLTFEDRDGDGKVEISTRDYAFDSSEGFSTSESPHPLVIFRLKGATLYYVSQAFWQDYEADISQARGQISKKELNDMLMSEMPGAKAPSPDQQDPKAEKYLHIRALVLQIALDYLYGGRGAKAWDTISEMWPENDRRRIRQVILRGRTNGVLSEINRQPAPPLAPPPTSP